MEAPRAEALLDSVTLAAVAAEIRALGPARVRGARQPAAETVVVTLAAGRARRHLLLSAHPHDARVHFVRRADGAESAAPFGRLLRARLWEARLAEVEQPPFNRILRLGFEALAGRLWLIAEVMGRHSNVILADGRVVLGALKVVTPRMSARRPVLPGRPYAPPPTDRPTPEALDLDALRALLDGAAPLAQRLSQGLLGVSPPAARELALRAGLDPAMPAAGARPHAERLLHALRALGAIVRGANFSPCVYTAAGRPVAFAPFPMRAYGAWTMEPAGGMSEAIERYYADAPSRPADALAERRAALGSAVRAAIARRQDALQRAREAAPEGEAAERHRLMGELIFAHAAQIGPRATVLRVPDYTADGREIAIPLDPGRTAAENARDYFRRYAKARAAARAAPARIARLEAEVSALRDALVQIDGAASPEDLREIAADLAAAGLAGRPPASRRAAPAGRPGSTGPRRFPAPGGGVILAGRSGRENERITFREAGPDDLWLHARGLAGAHVVLKTSGPPPEEAVRAAAGVAAYYSAGRGAGHVAVDAVARKRVRKQPGGPPGRVTYSGERTLFAAPALPERAR
jgi:predicted ribosome quality control (RQC) complex YloA/Tae2 family protein